MKKILRARADTAITNAGQRIRAGIDFDADVGDDELKAKAACQHAYCRATARDIPQHLGRDRLGIRTHTRIRDAVVRDENRDRAPARRCGRVVADSRVAAHDLLEIAEAPMRLRQRIEPRSRGPCRLSVERFDSRQRFLEQTHAGSSVKMDRQIAELCIAVASAWPSSSDLPSHESK